MHGLAIIVPMTGVAYLWSVFLPRGGEFALCIVPIVGIVFPPILLGGTNAAITGHLWFLVKADMKSDERRPEPQRLPMAARRRPGRIAIPLSRIYTMRPSMVRAVKPSRKRDGRLGPPDRYPKDPEKYADPANWKYPVHTPFHARAARRYFNKPENRAKYAPEEQAYIDRKINEALERFGVAVKTRGGEIEEEAGIIQADVPLNKDIDRMSLEDLLLVLLGRNRLKSAKGIESGLVSVDKESTTLWSGTVKDYSVRIDTQENRIEHDCADWRSSRAKARLFCKHLGAFVMRIDPAKAVRLLRDLLRERDRWTFE